MSKQKMREELVTMFKQFGGSGAMIMIGGSVVFDNDQLRLIIQFKGSRKHKICELTYDEVNDLYDMKIFKFDNFSCDKINTVEHNGLYADMLKPCFEDATGLYLSL